MTTLLLICVLATVAAHRIWNYEDIFAPVRSLLGAKVLIDPAWNGLWIAPIIAAIALIEHPSTLPTLAVLAGYPLLRGLVALYARFAPPAAVCSPCEEKRKAFQAKIDELRKFSRRVIMLGAGLEQANWLAQKHKDWAVILFGLGDEPKKLWKNVRYRKVTPTTVAPELQNTVFMCGNATVVVWNVTHTQPWAQAVEAHKNMKAVSWVHVGLSDPATVPPHHSLVALGDPVDIPINTTQAPL
jgi:hypothetical protein